MCGRCRQRAYLQRHHGRKPVPRVVRPEQRKVLWMERSALFRFVIAQGWTPEGREGTPAEWDTAMLRAYGPGVEFADIARACRAAPKMLPPHLVLEPLRERWARPAVGPPQQKGNADA